MVSLKRLLLGLLGTMVCLAFLALPTSADASPPSAPHDIRVHANPDESLTVTWLAPQDDGGAPIQGYILERLTQHGWLELGRPSETLFVDLSPATDLDGLVVGYRVAAYNAVGESPATTSFSLMHVGSGSAQCWILEEEISLVAVNVTCAIIFLTSQNGVPSSVNQQARTTLMLAWGMARGVLDQVPILGHNGSQPYRVM